MDLRPTHDHEIDSMPNRTGSVSDLAWSLLP